MISCSSKSSEVYHDLMKNVYKGDKEDTSALTCPLHTQVSLKQNVSCPSLHQVDLKSLTVAQRSENTKDDNILNGANVSCGTIEDL